MVTAHPAASLTDGWRGAHWFCHHRARRRRIRRTRSQAKTCCQNSGDDEW